MAVVRFIWRKPIWLVVLGAVVFLTVEVSFFAANLTKIVHGGWLPIVVAVRISRFCHVATRADIVTRNRTAKKDRYATSWAIDATQPPVYRVPGTAVFLNASIHTAPLALRANVEHNHVLHEAVVIVTIEFAKVPHIPPAARLTVDDLGYRDDGITHITARFGFQDDPNVPKALRAAADGDRSRHGRRRRNVFPVSDDHRPTDARGMPRWQKRLFLTSRTTLPTRSNTSGFRPTAPSAWAPRSSSSPWTRSRTRTSCGGGDRAHFSTWGVRGVEMAGRTG